MITMIVFKGWSTKKSIEAVIWVFLVFLKNSFSKQPTARTPEEIRANLTKHKVVPDVLDTYPETPILIRYSEFVNADLGNDLSYEDIEEYVPLISWPAKEGKFYTLIMLDPDNPTAKNPTKRSWVHWLVGNMPYYHVMMGDHIIKYQETRPANGTGFHRYVALIYEQTQGKIKFNESHIHEFNHDDEKVRAKFSAPKFAEKYNLGKPIGINFFRAEWAYVSPYDDDDD